MYWHKFDKISDRIDQRAMSMGDTLFDREELDKEEDCRMKALQYKNEARGWD